MCQLLFFLKSPLHKLRFINKTILLTIVKKKIIFCCVVNQDCLYIDDGKSVFTLILQNSECLLANDMIIINEWGKIKQRTYTASYFCACLIYIKHTVNTLHNSQKTKPQSSIRVNKSTF